MVKKAFFSFSVISAAVAVILLFGARIQQADEGRDPASLVTVSAQAQTPLGNKIAQ